MQTIVNQPINTATSTRPASPTVGLCGFGKHDCILEGGFRRHCVNKLKGAHLMIDQDESTGVWSELARHDIHSFSWLFAHRICPLSLVRQAAQALLGVGKRLPCMNSIILHGADAELSETEHSPAHRCKHDLLVRNASRQGSAPSSMVLMNGGSALHRR